MKPLLLPEEMRKADEAGVELFHLSWDLLMETAGREAAREIEKYFGGVRGKNVLVICGKGNNGGDGMCLARWLSLSGARTHLILLAEEDQWKGEARAQFLRAKAFGIPSSYGRENRTPPQGKWDFLVDAIFGTGLDRPVVSPERNWIEWINMKSQQEGIPVISIDVPSGISGKTGEVLGVAVKARLTITMQEWKLGLALYPGAQYAGEIRRVMLGYPSVKDAGHYLLEKEDMVRWLPRWEKWVHKGIRGKVVICGGSPGLTGALTLAGNSAARSGAGLVWVAFPSSLSAVLETKLTEVMKIALPEEQGFFSPASAEILLERMQDVDSLVLGPGIGRSPSVDAGVQMVVSRWEKPLVLDADALYVYRNGVGKLRDAPAEMVLTPHSGEMARLMGITPEEVERDRVEIARRCAQETGKVVLLKGARSLIATPEGRVYVNPTGNEGMATGGSGDVLAGMIGAFLGMGLPAEKSAACGAFLHGLAGDIAVKALTVFSCTATDILAHIPHAFQEVLRDESPSLG
ncbi:MAG: NAD(P)H-hydrate dehydratase [bacterium JZ-2024 1]